MKKKKKAASRSTKTLSFPKIVWANRLNRFGLISQEPIECHLETLAAEHAGCGAWTAAGGEHSFWVDELGVEVSSRNMYVSFASASREEVIVWMTGVRSVFTVLSSYEDESLSHDVIAKRALEEQRMTDECQDED